MANMTLSIPDDVYVLIKKYSHVRWSEVARRAIVLEAEKLAWMDKVLEKSTLTAEDIREIDEKVKEGVYRRFKDAIGRGQQHIHGGTDQGLHHKENSAIKKHRVLRSRLRS